MVLILLDGFTETQSLNKCYLVYSHTYRRWSEVGNPGTDKCGQNYSYSRGSDP